MNNRIESGHGSGGTMTRELIRDVFLRYFDNEWIRQETDSAVIDVSGKTLAFTTDSYVISPLFFPGGDIGKLSVCGTVNDLAVAGARPAYITAGFILEEGLSLNILKKIVKSMRVEADRAAVSIVAGDTKVVGKGQADGMYINTSGIGFIDDRHKNIANGRLIKEGDVLIVNGTMGDHESAVINAREGFFRSSRLESDCSSLNGMIGEVMANCNTVHFMRDITRGGLSGILNETAELSELGIEINESNIPFDESVTAFCEALGYDPLHFANEGKCIVIVPEDEAGKVLSIMHNHESGKNAAIIGKFTGDHPGGVIMETLVGGKENYRSAAGSKSTKNMLNQLNYAGNMHELTVVENIIRISVQVAKENKLNYITAVNLDAGCMQHLNEEIMKHGFDAAKEGTLLTGSILSINRVPVKLRCNGCGHIFGPVDGKYFCPDCGDKDTSVVQGMELIITSIEGE